MPATATTATASTRSRKTLSKQVEFTTNKLIRNLGSNTEQYHFQGNLRTAYGRD